MTQLGKYELHEQLGKGGFGTVYRATDTSLGRAVALKILHPQMAADAEFVERFRKEARLAAALESANVVTIYEVGEQDGRYFIAMRYYPGGSLGDLLKKGALSWEQAELILKQVCAGVQKLHAKGWVHRDLKLSNILFDDEGQPVVADFGLARALTASGSSSGGSMGAGTPFYRAPELWNGKPPASPATDVYALGCILGEMLTGKPLFPGETPEEVLTRHLVHGPDFGENWPPAGVPEGTTAFVQRCLSKSPSDRPADAAEFFRELKAAGKQAIPAPRQDEPTPPVKVAPDQKPVVDKPAPERHLTSSSAGWKGLSRTALLSIAGAGLLGMIAAVVAVVSIVEQSQRQQALLARQETQTAQSFRVTEITQSATEIQATARISETPDFQATETALSTLPATVEPATLASASSDCAQIGQAQVSEIDGMTLLCVPAGEFIMGSDNEVDSQAYSDELPQHIVYLDHFWIDRTEVTNAMYDLCITSGYCTVPGDWSSYTRTDYFGDSAYADYPVIYVDWEQANTYCKWAGRRLPSEAEWEKAARGTDGRIYPWGNESPTDRLLNFNWNNGDTSPVGGYPDGKSPYGVLDMAGNVWEWVADWYDSSYYQNSPTRNPTGPPSGSGRVLRGGSWYIGSNLIRAAYRGWSDPDRRYYVIGFRCAR